MDYIATLLSIFTAVTSLVAAISSIYGIYQKRRIDILSIELDKNKKKLNSTRTELYKVYLNVSELLQIGENLTSELEIGKRTARKGFNTNRYIQPKHVENKIKELELDIL